MSRCASQTRVLARSGHSSYALGPHLESVETSVGNQDRVRDFSNNSHGTRSGQGSGVLGRSGLQRGEIVSGSLSWSRRISTQREFRSTGWSGRRGRIMCELRVRADEFATADCLRPPLGGRGGGVYADSRRANWLALNRRKRLPFRSALTFLGPRCKSSAKLYGAMDLCRDLMLRLSETLCCG